MNFDERLKELEEQVVVKRKIDKLLTELRSLRKDLNEEVDDLHQKMVREQSDVDRLEGSGLTSAFYDLIGKKGDKLAKERGEADEARDQYEDARDELADINQRIQKLESQALQFVDSEREYQEVLDQKIAAIMALDNADARTLKQNDATVKELHLQKQEIGEAIVVGKEALTLVNEVVDCLNNAGTWGVVDMFSDSFFTDMIKHSELDKAQQLTDELQQKLKQFESELSDITITSNIQISVDGFNRFMDYWFDNVFIDWMVMDHIRDSQNKIAYVKKEVEETLQKLKGMDVAANNLLTKLAQDREKIIANAKI